MAVNLVQAGPSVMTGITAVGDYFYDAVRSVPHIAGRSGIAVHDFRCVRPSVNVHVDRILLRRVETYGINDECRQFETVAGGHRDDFRSGEVRSLVVRTSPVGDLVGTGRLRKVVKPDLVRS